MSTKVTVIPGDGIGPEIMKATLHCLEALQCDFEWDFKQAGLIALDQTGVLVPQETLDSIRNNGIVLKGPLTTPVGEGFSSVNVSLRKEFDLYANVRPVISMPGTRSRSAAINAAPRLSPEASPATSAISGPSLAIATAVSGSGCAWSGR
jgi:isocitrate dehydrogenase (NAD+)